jgi:hypothetical protein
MSLWEDMDGQGRSLAGRVRGLAAFGGQARLWPATVTVRSMIMVAR